jgi:hypothetical protein
LVLEGEKLVGSAQRRIPGRVLQHGSLLLAQRFATHPGASLGQPSAEAVARWTAAFVAGLATALELLPQPAQWSAAGLADVAGRRHKYAGPAWTHLR